MERQDKFEQKRPPLSPTAIQQLGELAVSHGVYPEDIVPERLQQRDELSVILQYGRDREEAARQLGIKDITMIDEMERLFFDQIARALSKMPGEVDAAQIEALRETWLTERLELDKVRQGSLPEIPEPSETIAALIKDIAPAAQSDSANTQAGHSSSQARKPKAKSDTLAADARKAERDAEELAVLSAENFVALRSEPYIFLSSRVTSRAEAIQMCERLVAHGRNPFSLFTDKRTQLRRVLLDILTPALSLLEIAERNYAETRHAHAALTRIKAALQTELSSLPDQEHGL